MEREKTNNNDGQEDDKTAKVGDALMNRDKEYWIKRFEYLEKAQIENEDKYVSTLLEEYDKDKVKYRKRNK